MGDRWRKPEEMGNLVFLTSMGSPIGRYNIESDMRYVTQQINDIFRTEALYSGGIPKNFEKIHLMHLDIHLQQDVLKRV